MVISWMESQLSEAVCLWIPVAGGKTAKVGRGCCFNALLLWLLCSICFGMLDLPWSDLAALFFLHTSVQLPTNHARFSIIIGHLPCSQHGTSDAQHTTTTPKICNSLVFNIIKSTVNCIKHTCWRIRQKNTSDGMRANAQ